MSRVQRRFEVPGHEPAALVQRLQGLGWTVQDVAGRIEGQQGSQVSTRLLGGWFVNASKLPKRLVAARGDAGLTVEVEETLGFGVLDAKLRRKYEDAFAELERQLRGG